MDILKISRRKLNNSQKFGTITQNLPLETVLIIYRITLLHQIQDNKDIFMLIGKDKLNDFLIASILNNKRLFNIGTTFKAGELALWTGMVHYHFMTYTKIIDLIRREKIVFSVVDITPHQQDFDLLYSLYSLRCFRKLKVTLDLNKFKTGILTKLSRLQAITDTLTPTDLEIEVHSRIQLSSVYLRDFWNFIFNSFTPFIRMISVCINESFLSNFGDFEFLSNCQLLKKLVFNFDSGGRFTTLRLHLSNPSLTELAINYVKENFEIDIHDLQSLKYFQLNSVSDVESLQRLFLNGLPNKIERLSLEDCNFNDIRYDLPYDLKMLTMYRCWKFPNFWNIKSLDDLKLFQLELNDELPKSFFERLPDNLTSLELEVRPNFHLAAVDADRTIERFWRYIPLADTLDLSTIPKNLQRLKFTYSKPSITEPGYNSQIVSLIFELRKDRAFSKWQKLENKCVIWLERETNYLNIDLNWIDFDYMKKLTVVQHGVSDLNILLDDLPETLNEFNIQGSLKSVIVSAPRYTTNLKRCRLGEFMPNLIGEDGSFIDVVDEKKELIGYKDEDVLDVLREFSLF